MFMIFYLNIIWIYNFSVNEFDNISFTYWINKKMSLKLYSKIENDYYYNKIILTHFKIIKNKLNFLKYK